MDNSNNQNSSNNSSPLPINPPPFPQSTSPLPGSTPIPAWPTSTQPASTLGGQGEQPATSVNATWAPSPTFPPPQTFSNDSVPSSSPLDNPWGAPVQTPPFDQNAQPAQPTWVPTSSNTSVEPAGLSDTTPVQPESPTIQPEPAPTDLSHLISSTSQPDSGQTIPSQSPEILVTPSTSTPEVSNLPTEDHKSIPKWLIGIGIGLLIIVLGASAYFILGIGQPNKNTASVPAQISKPVVKTPPPIATPIPQTAPTTATGSANFGDLQGAPAASPKQATRAGDLLK